jgi:hypothetical protein
MPIFLNGELVKFKQYPDGSSRIDKEEKLSCKRNDRNVIDFFHFSPFDIQDYLVLESLLWDCNLISTVNVRYSGWLRQDKTNISLNEGGMLRHLGSVFKEAVFCEPHCDEELLSGSSIFDEYSQLNFKNNGYVLFAPDKGAAKRYKIDLFAGKKRLKDGKIVISIDDAFKNDISGKKICIFDDICDGGWTFRLAAQELKRLGANNIALRVYHGLFSCGTQFIYDSGISEIYARYDAHNIKTGEQPRFAVTLKRENNKLVEV